MIQIITTIEADGGTVKTKQAVNRKGPVNDVEIAMARQILTMDQRFINQVAEASGEGSVITRDVKLNNLPEVQE